MNFLLMSHIFLLFLYILKVPFVNQRNIINTNLLAITHTPTNIEELLKKSIIIILYKM